MNIVNAGKVTRAQLEYTFPRISHLTLTKMRSGPTNPQLQELISELKKRGFGEKQDFWIRIAEDLEKPTRQRRVVNLSKINRYTKKGEVIVVPGKVLASGDIGHEITVAAWKFSEEAVGKLQKAKGSAITISQLMKQNPQGKDVRIIG